MHLYQSNIDIYSANSLAGCESTLLLPPLLHRSGFPSSIQHYNPFSHDSHPFDPHILALCALMPTSQHTRARTRKVSVMEGKYPAHSIGASNSLADSPSTPRIRMLARLHLHCVRIRWPIGSSSNAKQVLFAVFNAKDLEVYSNDGAIVAVGRREVSAVQDSWIFAHVCKDVSPVRPT
jgi:hypothetical protein